MTSLTSSSVSTTNHASAHTDKQDHTIANMVRLWVDYPRVGMLIIAGFATMMETYNPYERYHYAIMHAFATLTSIAGRLCAHEQVALVYVRAIAKKWGLSVTSRAIDVRRPACKKINLLINLRNIINVYSRRHPSYESALEEAHKIISDEILRLPNTYRGHDISLKTYHDIIFAEYEVLINNFMMSNDPNMLCSRAKSCRTDILMSADKKYQD